MLFGEEAVKNRMSVNLVRPLENGVIREGTERDEEAVRAVVGGLDAELSTDEELLTARDTARLVLGMDTRY